MKLLPSLSGSKVTCGVSMIRCLALLFLHLVTTSAFCQRSYFEYNNPDAMKLGKDVIARLTADEWEISDVRWLIRKDTFDYDGRALLKLKDNWTYKSGVLHGTWQIKYDRYLVLTDTNHVQQTMGGISGTYGIISLTDSMLLLQKIHTTSRDMSKTMTLIKYEKGKRHYPISFKYGRPPEEMRRLHAEWRRRDAENFRPLIDSLVFLSKEELAFLGYRESNDTLFFETSDSVYRVRLDRHNALRKVKIFYETEDVADLEAFRRFTLPENLVPLVDSLAMNYIRKRRDDYAPQKEITSLMPYFRQYVGYFDVNGEAIVLLNAFCQYKNDWRQSLVQVGLGGVCYFNVSVNLTKKEAFSFHVNDF